MDLQLLREKALQRKVERETSFASLKIENMTGTYTVEDFISWINRVTGKDVVMQQEAICLSEHKMMGILDLDSNEQAILVKNAINNLYYPQPEVSGQKPIVVTLSKTTAKEIKADEELRIKLGFAKKPHSSNSRLGTPRMTKTSPSIEWIPCSDEEVKNKRRKNA